LTGQDYLDLYDIIICQFNVNRTFIIISKLFYNKCILKMERISSRKDSNSKLYKSDPQPSKNYFNLNIN